MIILHLFPNCASDGLQSRQEPSIHDRTFGRARSLFQDTASLNIGIHDEETVDVMEGAHEFLQCFVNSVNFKGALCPRRTSGEHIPPHRVRALFVQNRPRIYGVTAALAHLLPIGCHDKFMAEAVFVGRLVVKERACRQKAVKPAARLIDGFGDKIRRIRLCQHLLILEWVVPLCRVRAARIKPAIDDIRHAMHHAAALIASENDIIDIRPVEFNIVRNVRASRF